MYPVTLSIEDVFKGSNIRTVQGAFATPTSNGLLENSIDFTERQETEKGHFNVTLECQNLRLFKICIKNLRYVQFQMFGVYVDHSLTGCTSIR